MIDSARGDDAAAQRDSSAYPFATLSRAFQQIRDGDTVLIYPGSYTEQPEGPALTMNQRDAPRAFLASVIQQPKPGAMLPGRSK